MGNQKKHSVHVVQNKKEILMFAKLTASISLGPLDINFDAPWWWYAGGLAIPFIGVVGMLVFARRAAKKGNIRFQRFSPWHYAGAIMVIYFVVVMPLLNKLNESRGGGGGPPVLFVQPQSTFIGSDIVFCLPDQKNDADIDLKWYLGGFLVDTPTVEFNALGRFPVGIEDFAYYVKKYWSEGPENRKEDRGSKKVYEIHLKLPTPGIIKKYGSLYTEGKEFKLPEKEAKDDFGAAWNRCGGASRFHDASGGGALIRIGTVFVGPDSDIFNDAKSRSIDNAYNLATTPDKSFGGQSGLDQARANTREKLVELIRSMNGSRIAELEAQGYVVEIIVDFEDDLPPPEVPVVKQ